MQKKKQKNTTLLLYLYQIFFFLLGHLHFFSNFFFSSRENLFKKQPISIPRRELKKICVSHQRNHSNQCAARAVRCHLTTGLNTRHRAKLELQLLRKNALSVNQPTNQLSNELILASKQSLHIINRPNRPTRTVNM